jgi:acyl dehydratase
MMPASLRVRAINTAPDSENRMHSDSVAAAYGFRGGLVPGVTVYGYMASATIGHFGPDWLERGAMDVRFRAPVYEGDEVVVSVRPDDHERAQVEAGQSAYAAAWIHQESAPPEEDYQGGAIERRAASPETLVPGTRLGEFVERLDLANSRMSAPLDSAIGPGRFAHPAILLALANRILMQNYELGPWIHAESEIRKFAAAEDGEEIRVRAKIDDRYERKGHEFVVLDVILVGRNGVVERIRHTAIWRPRIA